ncbi:DNA mismatch repair protein MutS [Flavobacterium sp. CYK-55]|uniref:Smr/MutS family protein n=1 Tax=Flavobacterium sp. CYK-55 TaxID=2835529 RepID=UPI001BCFE651|nr:Smr/MutS family protein [Flavobacterium sp. CYK-55]MBS7786945.1 DNA mismatch repair protein MutS [Flavobacterium sp. CYK-55]
MSNFKLGDQVSVLDDAIDGVITTIQGDKITIETTDGFPMTYFVNQLVKNLNTSDLTGSIKSFNAQKIQEQKEAPLKHKQPVSVRQKGEIPPPEFDLHIEKLVKNHKILSNYQILNLQIETAQRHVEFAIRNRIPKIVFIHGVGEGVLKADLDAMLSRYDQISFQDANYQKYGLGATEVYFKQPK